MLEMMIGGKLIPPKTGWVKLSPNFNTVALLRGSPGSAAIIDDILYSQGGTGTTAPTANLFKISMTTLARLSPDAANVLAPNTFNQSFIAYQGLLYRFGGHTTAGNTNNTASNWSRFDPSTNTWTALTLGPSARAMTQMFSYNGFIYLFSGYQASQGAQVTIRDFWRYDVAGNTWTQIIATAPPPTFEGGRFCEIDGIQYLIGSSISSTPTNIFWSYDQVAGTWAQKANLPVSLRMHGAAAHNGKLYVFGGQTASAPVNTLYEYTPSTNTWANLSATITGTAPSPRTRTYVFSWNNRLLMLGGDEVTATARYEAWEYKFLT